LLPDTWEAEAEYKFKTSLENIGKIERSCLEKKKITAMV
jgi:hypothetical protein